MFTVTEWNDFGFTNMPGDSCAGDHGEGQSPAQCQSPDIATHRHQYLVSGNSILGLGNDSLIPQLKSMLET
jgi:hypothetical protein